MRDRLLENILHWQKNCNKQPEWLCDFSPDESSHFFPPFNLYLHRVVQIPDNPTLNLAEVYWVKTFKHLSEVLSTVCPFMKSTLRIVTVPMWQIYVGSLCKHITLKLIRTYFCGGFVSTLVGRSSVSLRHSTVTPQVYSCHIFRWYHVGGVANWYYLDVPLCMFLHITLWCCSAVRRSKQAPRCPRFGLPDWVGHVRIFAQMDFHLWQWYFVANIIMLLVTLFQFGWFTASSLFVVSRAD